MFIVNRVSHLILSTNLSIRTVQFNIVVELIFQKTHNKSPFYKL